MTEVIENQWKAEQLRLTLFLKDIVVPGSSTFEEIFSTQVDYVVSNTKLGETSFLGVWKDYKVEFKQTINRIDIVVRPPEVESGGYPVSFIENAMITLIEFLEVVGHWADRIENIYRIAVGLNGFLNVENTVEAYTELNNRIHLFEIDNPRMSDLVFQVNLPTESTVMPDLKINRLSSWAALVYRAQLSGTGTPDSPTYLQEHFAKCATDISTDGDSFVNLVKISQLIAELGAITKTIFEKGIN